MIFDRNKYEVQGTVLACYIHCHKSQRKVSTRERRQQQNRKKLKSESLQSKDAIESCDKKETLPAIKLTASASASNVPGEWA